MRLAVIALSLTTVTFAASTIYLARELSYERANAAMQPSLPQASAPAAVALPAPTPAQLPSAAERSASTVNRIVMPGQPAMTPEFEAQMLAEQRAAYRQIVERFDDPERRAEMIAEFKGMVRNGNPGLATALNLTREDANRLIDLLALQQAENQARYARCELDGPCDVQKIGQYGADTTTQEIANLLGPEGQQKYSQYRMSVSEREGVTQFRSRLADPTHLPDDTAEALITALADERTRISTEASQRGVSLDGIGNGNGMVWISTASDSPEARFESAKENSRRFRARAADVLTPAQMRTFEEMQDELLLSMRHQLRQKQQFSSVTSSVDN